MGTKKWSFRDINDEIDRLCSEGIDAPPELDDVSGLITPVEVDGAALEKALEALEMAAQEKAYNLCRFCQKLDAQVGELDEEIKRLTVWRNQLKGHREWLSWYGLQNMLRAGVLKVTGKLARISVRKSPVSVSYVLNSDSEPDVHNIDPRYVRTIVTHKVDRAGVLKARREALKRHIEEDKAIEDFKFEACRFRVS